MSAQTTLFDTANTSFQYSFTSFRKTDINMSQLLPEILVMIFNHLDVRDKGRVAQVCRAWRDAAYLRSVWKGVEAKLHLRRSNPYLFPSLVKRGIRRVQVLSLRRSLRDVTQGIPDLESLNMIGCFNLTDALLNVAFTSGLSSLRHLNLSMCKQLTDNSLMKIVQVQNLESLDLGGCSNISNTGLLVIAWGLRNLRTLNLRSCRNISDLGIAHLCGRTADSTRSVDTLEHLSLQDCQKLTDEALDYISTGLVKLRSINLSFCASVTDSGVRCLARMQTLDELNLRSCDNISNIAMAYLAESGSRISSLDVSFCVKVGDQGVVHIAKGLSQIRSLSVNACDISDEGLCRLARSGCDLRALNLGQCVKITDRSLLEIAANFPNLQCIDLYGCTNIRTLGLERIMKLKHLRVLNLGLWQRPY